MAAAVGMHQGPRPPLRQCFHNLDEHLVGQLRVGTGTAVYATILPSWQSTVGERHALPVPGLDLGDVRQPLLIRPFGREVAVGEVVGSRRCCVCSIEVRPMQRNYSVRKSGRN